MRDVTFDDTVFYDPSELDLGHVLREKTTGLLTMIEIPDLMKERPIGSVGDSTDLGLDPMSDTESIDTAQDDGIEEGSSSSELAADKILNPASSTRGLLTPSPTPDPCIHSNDPPAVEDPLSVDHDSEKALSDNANGQLAADAVPTASRTLTSNFDAQNILPEGSKRVRKARKQAYAAALGNNAQLSAFHSAFAAGLIKVPQINAFHRDTLPAEPRSWKQLQYHLHGAEFRQAAKAEIQSLEKRETFKYIK
jgi:hypothetical protein